MERKPTLTRASHGVTVRRGFSEVFLSWKSVREIEELRDLPRVQNWLFELLLDGPCAADAIMSTARKQRYGKKIVWRARRALDVRTRRRGGVRCWSLPR